MTKTIEIDGKNYQINIEKAIKDGYLVKEKQYPKMGDKVIVMRNKGAYTLLVVRVSDSHFMLIVLKNGNRFSDNTLYGELSVENWDYYMKELGITAWKVIED